LCMGNPLGVRRDFDVLESRRLEAARLLREGSSQAEVARRVGVGLRPSGWRDFIEI
jgi:DNA-binding NarL/FixJ family response regulator